MKNKKSYKVDACIFFFVILTAYHLSNETNTAYGNKDYQGYYERYDFVVCGQVIQKYPSGYIGVDGPKYVIKIENKYKGANGFQQFEAIGLGGDSNGYRVQPLEIKERGIFFVHLIDEKYYSIVNSYAKVPKCSQDFIPTPLGQYKFGIKANEVLCLVGNHSLIIKASNGMPACVNSETVEKLIERDWADPSKYRF